ncbi:MAG: hypothetical protein ABSA75_13420 [Candidatus Bathyarchaeia archaeon]
MGTCTMLNNKGKFCSGDSHRCAAMSVKSEPFRTTNRCCPMYVKDAEETEG